MSQQTDSSFINDIAAGAIGQFLRVKTRGALVVATATDLAIGFTDYPILAAGGCTIIAPNKQGTVKVVSNGIIAKNGNCYAAASGKVAPTGTIIEGKAFEAAGADGDIIEMLPIHNRDVSTATSGTTSATFAVDTDAVTPKIALAAQTAGTGNFTTTLRPEATLSADSYAILPETADGDVLVSLALAQTLTNKTLTSPYIGATPRFGHTVTPVAAAGATVADAGALADTMITHVTSDGAGKGVKLPAVTTAGVIRIVINDTAGTACELYAESTGTVNGLAADASIVLLAATGVLCISTAAKTWLVWNWLTKSTAS